MVELCAFCGGELAPGDFCPSCGAPRAETKAADPVVGQTIAERYDVVELINSGAIGRIYRASQRGLDRNVALKLIHPHLLSSDTTAARFLSEARAASRLNHPNVVSIYDFGRATLREGERLFLVMELLSGSDLARVLDDSTAMPLDRVANILRQVLAALAEAHHLGVTHRDVKPENVLLETKRGGRECVKVIDFGMASLRGEARLTRAGECVGTPDYMSPEQIRGDPARPGDDLYASGVLLFRMLTGRLPFASGEAMSVMADHLSSPRPDPRLVAPERSIPPPLAEVCLRAISLHRAHRYQSAEALAEAIVRAATSGEWSASDASLFPSRPAREPTTDPAASASVVPSAGAGGVLAAPRLPRESLGGSRVDLALLGRESALAWAAEHIQERSVAGMAFFGATGMGRSRLLDEVAALAAGHGTLVLHMSADPRPLSEVGFGGLRKLIARFAGVAETDPALASGRAAADSVAAEGLRHVFPAAKQTSAPSSTVDVGRAASAALRWAAHRACDRAKGAHVLVALDDFDRFDSATRAALSDLATCEPIRRFQLVLTTDAVPRGWPTDRFPSFRIPGLTRAEAARLFGSDAPLPERAEESFEPLYVEQLRRWIDGRPERERPSGLFDLLEACVLSLPPAQRRTLLAVAVLGRGSLDELAALAPRPEDVGESLRPLADSGIIEVHGGYVATTHPLFARIALGTAPAGATAELHARRAEALLVLDDRLELSAYHAIRGHPDFEAFLLVEESARIRLLRGDPDAAIAVLWDGMYAARSLVSKGEAEAAASAWIVFGRKLSAIQIDLGRYHEARTVLTEIAERLRPSDAVRIEVLEQLAVVAQHLERPDEAQRLRREATHIAERRSDTAPPGDGSARRPTMPLPLPQMVEEPPEREVTVGESGINEKSGAAGGPGSANQLAGRRKS